MNQDKPKLQIMPAHAWCRGLSGHAWRHPNALHLSNGAIKLDLKCLNCGANRLDSISPNTGMLNSRKYVYPDDYLQRGLGRLAPGTLRKVAIGALTK